MITLLKEMELGVESIDNQHKDLVNRLNTLTSMNIKSISKEETKKTLNLLGEHITKHFSDEEALQVQSEYPEYETHKKLHQLYVLEFNDLKSEFTENGASTKFTSSLNRSIVNWIVNHIKTVDAEFGKYYQNRIREL
jgi:hemerythrin